MKIVIVDDNESMRKVLRALCEGEGHEVIAEFGDGVGLLNYVAEQRPDVVCLDFELPGLNGLELLVQMDVAVNQVDVVMITASDDPELKGHAADLGAKGFIHKPFEQAQVIDELKEIAQTRAIAARAEATPEAVEPTPPPPAESMLQVVTVVVPRSAVIVDDSGSIRLLLKGILSELGIKVLGVASNGRDGIEMVKKTRPALVCLDIDMPGMTGLEALPEIRAASPQTKVVMITGNAGRSIVEASVAGGAKGYFLKPIRPGKVEEFMRKLFQM
ncbi:MAG: response regulator [Sulfuritalea sp.]|nr:response regulator [Sulfuritalea sp.]